MNSRFAYFLSVILHPLLMPCLLFGMLFFSSPNIMGVGALPVSVRFMLIGFIGIITFVLPCLSIYYLYRGGHIKSINLDNLSDRRLPYFITTLIYLFAIYFFRFQLAPLAEIAPAISVILGSITFSILLVGLISLQWKISAHGTGIGGFLGALFGFIVKFGETQLIYPYLLFIILAGLLLGARLKLNAHTPEQVAAGTALGMLISIATVWFFV